MATSYYKVVSCEGGDQVGKADAMLNLKNYLLDKSVPITYSSFPIYATPIGMTIRLMLKEGTDTLNLDKEEDINIRMALFALNRLEFLDILLSDEKYKDTLIVLDRSSFSNALTIAFALDNTGRSVDDLIEYALDLDSFMIKTLDLKKCIIHLLSEEKEWKSIRKKNTDRYESKNVQEKCNFVYDFYAKKIGDGWHKVVTKDSEGWRDRQEILNNTISVVEGTFGILESSKSSLMYNIGIEEILKNIYPKSVCSENDLKLYSDALMNNNKDRMYEYAVKVGKQISLNYPVVQFQNTGVKEEFKRILSKEPKILDVLSFYTGNEFTNNLIGAVDYE